MELITHIEVTKTTHSKLKEVNWEKLEFGDAVSDHMFVAHFKKGAWHHPEIKPFQSISLSPTALSLHYGQSVFEGMKAFRMQDGRISVFRIDKHYDRFVRSLERMCMPSLPYDLFVSALQQLLQVDEAWVPKGEDKALYIRPFVFATEAKLGVKVSEEFSFMIVTGPVSTVYKKPIKVKVEQHYSRAAKGGTGSAKCAGNYGGAFYPTQKAKEEGFDQLLWMNALEPDYFEESGMMNLMFVLEGKLVTPPLSDSILDGVTRDSFLTLAKNMGIKTEERKIGIKEIVNHIKAGKAIEAFGAGTAAVVAPIGLIGVDDERYALPTYTNSSIMYQLKKELEAIRTGIKPDVHGWNTLL